MIADAQEPANLKNVAVDSILVEGDILDRSDALVRAIADVNANEFRTELVLLWHGGEPTPRR